MKISIFQAEILDMIDHDNDGIRTNAIKFLEGVVILQTYPDEDSMKRENDFSLENIPLTLKIVRRRKLEDEAISIFETLLKFHAASHISSVNLIACTGSLCTIAKMRPTLMFSVVEALKNLNSNLPPTLSDSQVNSVRKHVKMQLLNIIKLPAAYEMQSTITNILVDLGSTNSEIAKTIPRLDRKEQARRAKRALENITAANAKRIKLEKSDKVPVRREMEIDTDEIEEQKQRSNKLNETFLLEHLMSKETVAELIMDQMKNLPDEVPSNFLRDYVPDASMTNQQRMQLIAQALAELMTAERLGPGASSITKEPPMRIKLSAEEEKNIVLGLRKDTATTSSEINLDEDIGEDEIMKAPEENIDARLAKEEATKKLRETMERAKGEQLMLPRMKQRVKSLQLQEVTKPLPRNKKESFLAQAVTRILNAEKKSKIGGVMDQRQKILTVLAATFAPNVRESIINFILSDMTNRTDLAFAWLFEEYSLLQGFTRHSYIKSEHKPDFAYNKLFSELIAGILEKTDENSQKIDLLKKLYLTAPMVSDDAFTTLVSICEMADLSCCGMELLKELTIRRPPKRLKYLNVLLRYALHDNIDLRERSIENLTNLYSDYDLVQESIEEHAIKWLKYLEKTEPPAEVFNVIYGRGENAVIWTETLSKACMSLFLAILPHRDELLLKLSEVYINTTPEMKRTILRSIETAIKKLGPENAQILKYIEQGQKGTEALIIRIIYILTERTIPNPELVKRVRDLYQTKVPDVRLLIPVITGFTKQEILAALPKLLKLNPVVVKEVFNRLLGIGSEYEIAKALPISASDLLVALHTLDPGKLELKFTVKATSLCLSEKDFYPQEILAIVLQQLVEIIPLPTLLMRTMLLSLTLYPRLAPFITNLLHRLVTKQVWKQKIVWEGFLKCCQRVRPASFPVLLSLPPAPLQDALSTCPELRQPLIDYANEAVEKQTIFMPKISMDILLGNSEDLFITVNSDNVLLS